ncbi:MAG TPA: CT253 family lipoprotein [Chlamydiales bacterium]|nr:CT253 family lipoprotein [Chlamydiales bacterium]
MRYLSVILSGLLAVSCNRTGSDEMSRFHEDGRAKPSVAIASMLDTTSFDASWSLSEELTAGIMDVIAGSGQIYVHSQEESPFTENPFGNDLSWMKREFHSEEFVAFIELVEHEFAPVQTKTVAPYESSNNLNMAVRVRVVDLRGPSPKIVLQEMVRETYFVPKTLIPVDYSSTVWGTDEYRKSPMGIAHAGLVQEVASRISDYILLAKSR